MAKKYETRATTKAMRELLDTWYIEVKKNLSGRVLKKRSHKLYKSIQKSSELRKPTQLRVSISSDAFREPAMFPYPAFHEYVSGRVWARSAALYALIKHGASLRLSIQKDVADFYYEHFVEVARQYYVKQRKGAGAIGRFFGMPGPKGPTEVLGKLREVRFVVSLDPAFFGQGFTGAPKITSVGRLS